jgi:hypothetical protein
LDYYFLEQLQQFGKGLWHPCFFLQKEKKNLSNSLAKDFGIFDKFTKTSPRRAYMRAIEERASDVFFGTAGFSLGARRDACPGAGARRHC